MLGDEYSNFEELAKNEVGNYAIKCIDRGAKITIIAPHGGKIEFNTTEIAKAIAGDYFNYYSFIGQKNSDNLDLHITSTNFDEPKALELVGKSEIVVAIHGCNNHHSKRKDYKEIFIGGLDDDLRIKFQNTLESNSLPICSLDTCDNFPSHFKGEKTDNICNKGITKKGVQLELTKAFRDDDKLRGRFISAVRHCPNP